MGNEGLNQITARFFKGFGTAEMRGIDFDQRGGEAVLADQKAQLVAEPGRIAIRTVRPVKTV